MVLKKKKTRKANYLLSLKYLLNLKKRKAMTFKKGHRMNLGNKYAAGKKPLIERYDIVGDCWVWSGSKDQDGYGRLGWEDKIVLAHRLFFKLHVGEIVNGNEIDHLCKNRACVNPKHLEQVTHTENCRRSNTTKLTQPIVDEIRTLWKEGGVNQGEIARMFNVTQHHISGIVNHKKWV